MPFRLQKGEQGRNNYAVNIVKHIQKKEQNEKVIGVPFTEQVPGGDFRFIHKGLFIPTG